MTSSYRARVHASVRTPTSGVETVSSARPSVPWALDELAASGAAVFTADLTESEADAAAAADHAHAVEAAYARGFADGEAKSRDAANVRVTTAQTLIARSAAKLDELANLAPAVLEENVAALAVVVARQIV